MWILPRNHSSSYIDQDDESFQALTAIFSESMLRLEKCIPNVPYNFVLHTAPLRSEPLEHYHWHFEIMPKLTQMAGFEWGTGFYINPTPPEDAARYLRGEDIK
jgi:UDPglucose--hexose-1-phosphate uridylyltransferase